MLMLAKLLHKKGWMHETLRNFSRAQSSGSELLSQQVLRTNFCCYLVGVRETRRPKGVPVKEALERTERIRAGLEFGGTFS